MVRLRRTRAWSPAAPCPPDQGWAGWRPQPVEGVHLLFLNRPPDDIPPDDGGATIVPAASLHHPGLPQPDGHRLFDLLTRHPDRPPGALVFLSDLSAELAGQGLSWPQVGIDYEAVTDLLVAMHRLGTVRALRLAQLSELAVTLLASGPHVRVYVAAPDGGPPELLDPVVFRARREELRAMMRADLERAVTAHDSN
jgi:hypothetical protein